MLSESTIKIISKGKVVTRNSILGDYPYTLFQTLPTVSGTPRIYVDNTLRVLEEDLRLYEETLEKLGDVEFPLKAFR